MRNVCLSGATLTSTFVYHNTRPMPGQQGGHIICIACLLQNEGSKSTRFAFLTVRIPAKSRWLINTETAFEFFH